MYNRNKNDKAETKMDWGQESKDCKEDKMNITLSQII